jgi:hypothetical protein
MDSGGLGALIGIGIMACGVCTIVLREKGGEFVIRIQKKYTTYRQPKNSLLPITKNNPIVVSTSLKHFQMKELLLKIQNR